MKRALFIVFVMCSVLLSVPVANAAGCSGGGVSTRLDPPLNPNGELANGMSFGTIPLTGVFGSKFNATTVYASWDRWNPGNVGAIETYFLYASSDGGATWSCTRSLALSAQISGVASGVEILVIVLASKGDTWAKSQLVKVPPVNPPTSVCPSDNYEFRITYVEGLKAFFLVMFPGVTSADPDSPYFAGKNQSAQFLNYTFEATVDNWKSKVIGKDSKGKTTFSLGYGAWIKPLDAKKIHTFRAIPVSSTSYPLNTSGCSPFTKSLLPKAQKIDPCAISVLDPNCKQEVVVGENAGNDSQVQPTVEKKATITCVKGKLTKKVTAIKPVCPAGYKKK